MKKLMIAAAIVCAAALSQAATVNWGATKIYTRETQGLETPTKLAAGAQYYCFLTEDLNEVWTKTITVEKATELAAAGDFETLATYAAKSGKTAAAGGITSSKLAGYSAGDTAVKGFAIILDAADAEDATYFMVCGDGTKASSPNFTKDSTEATITLGSQASSTWQAVSVPEPTSGLLLLLGLGAMALRRRRA